jgi:hypothetical protein
MAFLAALCNIEFMRIYLAAEPEPFTGQDA